MSAILSDPTTPSGAIRIKKEMDYLTSKELSERYRGLISVRTLANWRSSGDGPPFVKVGGRVLYPVEAVKEWERRRSRVVVRTILIWLIASVFGIEDLVRA